MWALVSACRGNSLRRCFLAVLLDDLDVTHWLSGVCSLFGKYLPLFGSASHCWMKRYDRRCSLWGQSCRAHAHTQWSFWMDCRLRGLNEIWCSHCFLDFDLRHLTIPMTRASWQYFFFWMTSLREVKRCFSAPTWMVRMEKRGRFRESLAQES